MKMDHDNVDNNTNSNDTSGANVESNENLNKGRVIDLNINHDDVETSILDHIKNSPAVFQSQQIGDPDLSISAKRKIAEDLLHKNPVNFLIRFGEFLEEDHLNYFLKKYDTSYEVGYHVRNLKCLLSDHHKKVIRRNRRYEAMKRMETEGSYFSETEMEKREPLLYHQMVGQYLSEKEKLLKSREGKEYIIPTFSNFLIEKMEREELNEIVKLQQEEEDGLNNKETSSEEDPSDNSNQPKLWGEDWEELKESSREKFKQKQHKHKKKDISAKEKSFLLQEFKSIMQNNFLNGRDSDFNYSEVDFNPEYDSIELRTQDEEEKYFDEETIDSTVCTDTGVEDY